LVALVCALMSVASLGLPVNVDTAGAGPSAKFLGPVLSIRENSETTFGRDGGFSAPLPNGKTFWIFADSPRYQFIRGKWRLTAFVAGSTATMAPFTKGKPLTTRMTEVNPGRPLKTTNKPAQFMQVPNAYIPGEEGVLCRKYQARRPSFSARWPVGVALMPNKKNLLIPYAVVCVLGESDYILQGWGIALFNYKTQKFTTLPTDVVPAQTNGAEMSTAQMWGSPIVHDNQVTFYSRECCGEGSGVFTTTIDASAAALKNPASYVPTPLPDVPLTLNVQVAKKSKHHQQFSMYVLNGIHGEYTILRSPSPTGPWTPTATGVLPRCDTSPRRCHSMALHTELSPAGRLNISYHLPGFGPGVATKHPYPHEPLRHVVSSSIPCGC
jgi:hypothetical protein